MKKYQLAAMATTMAMTLSSGDAFASGASFSDMATSITGEASAMPKVMAAMAYVGGVGLGIAGVLKLKSHVDNPQTPLKEGLIRLGAAGGLLALPTILEAAAGNIGASTGTSSTVGTFSNVGF